MARKPGRVNDLSAAPSGEEWEGKVALEGRAEMQTPGGGKPCDTAEEPPSGLPARDCATSAGD
jgi:hypothetical protein